MKIHTVTGLVAVDEIGLADAHGHAWIAPPEGVAPDVRIELNDFDRIEAELHDFEAAGGALLVDCQPGGCGRDTTMLAKLSFATDVYITATTGFHRQRYYAPDNWLWTASLDAAAAYFIAELTTGTRESGGTIPATMIKVGYEGVFDGQAGVLMEAAAEAARQTGALILFHTEQGKNVEALLPFFADRQVRADRLYLCHVDKRPDIGLHRDLAQAGVLLGYDTFVRPQYDPEQGVWPLVRAMVAEGLGEHIAIGLDMAMPSMLKNFGGKPGLTALREVIMARLRTEGIDRAEIARLTGQNIVRYLVRHQESA